MTITHGTRALCLLTLLCASQAMAALDCTAKELGGNDYFSIREATDRFPPAYFLVRTFGGGEPNPSVDVRPANLVRKFRLGDMIQYEFAFPFQVQGNGESATMQLDTLTRSATWLHTRSAYNPETNRFDTTRTLYTVQCNSI